MSTRMTGSDVKTATTTSSATGGVALTSAMGSVTTFANVEMAITGFDLTASLGSINLINNSK